MKNYYGKLTGVVMVFLLALSIGGCKGKDKTAEKADQKAGIHGEAGTVSGQSFDDIPEVVAKVNGTGLKKSDLQKIHSIVSSQAKMSGKQLNDDELLDVALGELINAELLKQEAVKKNISPSEESVSKELGLIKSQFPDDGAFEARLKERGLTVEEVKKNITDQLAVQELLDSEIERKIVVSKEAIEKFYNENEDRFKHEEQIKASHILIKSDEAAGEEKMAESRKKITDILARAKKGEDFAGLAKKYSEGPSAPSGGDLGFFSRGDMVKPFEDAAFALKKGEVSDVVQTRFGFHIIKLFDRKESGISPLSEVEDKIKAFLTTMEGSKLFNKYIEKLRSSAVIEKLI